MNRRHFLSATLAGSAAVAAAAPPKGIIDCQSHLFFPEVLDMMRKRKTEPLVHDDKGTVFLKMGDWLRKVPPFISMWMPSSRPWTPAASRSPC